MSGRAIAATYEYRDERGELLFEVVRYEPKDFRQRRPDGKGGWRWDLGDSRRVLYRLPELLAADPARPVFVAEGEKDVERLRSLGLVATTSPGGAGKWRAEYGEALRGREVVVLPDNDAAGRRHADAVAAALASVATAVRVLAPPGLSEKGDISDWLDAGRCADDLVRLAAAAPPFESAPSAVGPYEVRGGSIVWLRPTPNGPVAVPLANFHARIEAEIVRDDGTEEERRLRISGALASGKRLTDALVSASEFGAMAWVIHEWGPGAIVHAGSGKQDHLRAAIQLLSLELSTERRYTHTGWRELEDGTVVYLHAAGAVGRDGLRHDIAVELEGTLARFALPEPPEGPELVAAIRASLGLLDVAPDPVTVPLFAAVWRAPLGAADFTVHLAGPTGVGKTELAALAQQHYGAAMDARNLPSTWESTANANEELCFRTKDALVVVDDFTASGSAADVQRRQRDAQRLLRAQGNRAGRQRMRFDTSLRPAHPPRGLILSTGEDVPRGQSLRARMLALELGTGATRWDVLSACQREARAGLYAAAMAAYLRWLAPRYAYLRRTFRADADAMRDRLASRGQHARTPSAVAEVALALHHFLAFAQDAAAITTAEAAELWSRCSRALQSVAALQSEHQAAYDPPTRFAELLASAIATGAAYVSGPDGEPPADATTWGWRRERRGVDLELRPQGARVGWLDGDDLYLDPDAALKEARRMAGDGEGLSGTPRSLHKALHDRGRLASAEPGRFTVRRELDGARRRVLHVRRDFPASRSHEAVRAVLPVPEGPMPTTAGPLAGPDRGAGVESGPRERSASTGEVRAPGPRGPDGPLDRDETPLARERADDPMLRAARDAGLSHGGAP